MLEQMFASALMCRNIETRTNLVGLVVESKASCNSSKVSPAIFPYCGQTRAQTVHSCSSTCGIENVQYTHLLLLCVEFTPPQLET